MADIFMTNISETKDPGWRAIPTQ